MVLCGGSKIGNSSWIGVGSIVKEKVVVGNNVVVGLGSIITKDIPDGETWAGGPARPFDEFKKIQTAIKNLIRK